MAQERLQKILAQAGVASRRAAEALIAKGEVRLNGRIVTELGVRANAVHDRIEVNGVRIVAERPAYYVLNKPREVITTLSDPEGRPTIGDLLKRIPERVYPVGRLDFHTSGVLLLTNDGELAQALLHPTRGVPKAYIVKVKGVVPLPKLEALRNGVVLDDGQRTNPSQLFVVREEKANTWLQITITEGRNRQIHRMCEAVGLMVMRLSRVAFADITAEGLRPGDYRPLTVKELGKLDKDFRNPATRQRVDQARIRRYAEAGFDFGDIPVVRAPRGPRRGNLSTQRAEAVEEREAERAAPKRDAARGPRFIPKRDVRDARDARDVRDAKAFAGKRGPRGAKPFPAKRGAGGAKAFPAKRDDGARDSGDAAKRFPAKRDARDTREAKRFPPKRDGFDAKRLPPKREGFEAKRFPPKREGFEAKRLPPKHDAREAAVAPPKRGRGLARTRVQKGPDAISSTAQKDPRKQAKQQPRRRR